MAEPHRVIATAGIISVTVGTINSMSKYNRPPSMRFLIGTGVAYLALSALAEGEPEVAKSLAIAIASTVVLGEGDGVFAYVNKYGEANTQPGAKDPKDDRNRRNREAAAMPDSEPTSRRDRVPAYPGVPRIG